MSLTFAFLSTVMVPHFTPCQKWLLKGFTMPGNNNYYKLDLNEQYRMTILASIKRVVSSA